MTNLGLEVALRNLKIDFHRAKVGDRHVLAMLKERGGIIGGETSGHVICLDRTTTGDGLVTALQVLAVMRRTGRTLSELTAGMPQFPQVLVNVKVSASWRTRGMTPCARRFATRNPSSARAVVSCCGHPAPSR